MSERKNHQSQNYQSQNHQSRNHQRQNHQGQKQTEDEIRQAEGLFRALTRQKVPKLLALLICVAAVGFGLLNGTQQGGQQGAQQAVQSSQRTEAGEQEIRYTFRTQEQLSDHFERHGVEMGYKNEEEYLAGANRVAASPDALHKLEAEDGDDVYYLEATNEFVIVSKKGYIRTYFEPEDGLAYYERQ